MTALIALLGILVLLVGGELLVRHASRLAITVGISPLVVGLTVVAFGTSSPELMTSVYGQWIGEGGLAAGNVIGSNIFNVLCILGFAALVAPLHVDTKLLRFEVPLVVGASVLVGLFAWSGTIGRLESGVLLAGLVAYTIWVIYQSRSASAGESLDLESATEVLPDPPKHWSTSVGLVALGLGLVVIGGRMFVSGAVGLARSFQVDETVIALTIVATGTSLPELVTSALASFRGHRDIAIGNVVGSNLFNLMGVLGLAGLVGPDELAVTSTLSRFDIPIMAATAIICLPVMFSGGRIDRWEGGVFLVYYVGYVVYLVLEATGHVAAPGFGRAMTWFVIPLTLLTLTVIVVLDHDDGAAEMDPDG